MPPVDRISTPRSASARAKSTRPVLSETEIRARSILGAAAAAGRSWDVPSVGDVEQDASIERFARSWNVHPLYELSSGVSTDFRAETDARAQVTARSRLLRPRASASSKPALVSASRSTRPASPRLRALASRIGHPRPLDHPGHLRLAVAARPQHHLLRGARARRHRRSRGLPRSTRPPPSPSGASALRSRAPAPPSPARARRAPRRPDADGSGSTNGTSQEKRRRPLAGPSRSAALQPRAGGIELQACACARGPSARRSRRGRPRSSIAPSASRTAHVTWSG